MRSLRTIFSKGLYYGVAGRLTRGYLHQLRKAFGRRSRLQWQPPERVRQRQFARLQRLIRHACRNVPYYRRLHAEGSFPEELTSLDQMASIPALTKRAIMADPDALVADTADREALLPKRSGGSSGELVHFFMSEAAVIESSAAEMWARALAGYRWGDPVVTLWGSHFDEESHETLLQRLHAYGRNSEMLIADHVSEARLAEMAARLSAFRPALLVGYVSLLTELAKYLEDIGAGRPGYPTAGIATAAEPLSDAQRHLLEEVFGRPVFDRYGAREVGLIATECDRHAGLHIDCENIWVDLDPCPKAGPGTSRLLVTKLCEFGFPLVRYELGDYTTGRLGECSCGRGCPTIDGLIGRQISKVLRRDGSVVTGEVFIAFLDFQPIRSYRVVQEADYAVRVEVVPDSRYDESAEAKILAQMKELLGDLPVEIRCCRHIERTVSGKLLPIISRASRPQLRSVPTDGVRT